MHWIHREGGDLCNNTTRASSAYFSPIIFGYRYRKPSVSNESDGPHNASADCGHEHLRLTPAVEGHHPDAGQIGSAGQRFG